MESMSISARDAKHFYIGQPLVIPTKRRWWHRFCAPFIVEVVDKENGVIQLRRARWSWLRFRWV